MYYPHEKIRPITFYGEKKEINVSKAVACYDCGYLVWKNDAQRIPLRYQDNNEARYFCQKHKKPYDVVHPYHLQSDEFSILNVRVDEYGLPIKQRDQISRLHTIVTTLSILFILSIITIINII